MAITTDIDVDALDHNQKTLLVNGICTILEASGLLVPDAVLNGPQLIQFMGDVADDLRRQKADTPTGKP